MSTDERSSLHACIAEYLACMKFEAAAEAFCREASIAPSPVSSGTPALERKWRSLVRLQRQVMELEDALRKKKDSVVPTVSGAWSVRTPSVSQLRGHRAAVTTLAAHSSSGLLASGSEDGTTKVWDLDRRSLLRTLTAHVDAVTCVCFEGDRLLTCSADNTAKVYGEDFQARATMTHQDSVLCGVFMNDRIATSSRDGEIKTWTLEGACLTTTAQAHDGWTRALGAVSYEDEDGDAAWLLAAGGSKEDVTLLATPAFSFQDEDCVVLRGHSHQIEALTWRTQVGNDARELATASRDNTIRVWRIRTPSLSQSCIAELQGHGSWVKSVSWCGDRLLSAGDDRTIKVWAGFPTSSSSSAAAAEDHDDLPNIRCLKTVDAAHPAFVASLAVNVPTGLLASGGADKVIKLWEMRGASN